MQYWTRFRGRVEGPFSADELLERTRRGKFSGLFEVSLDGHKWGKVTQFSELHFVSPKLPPKKTIGTSPRQSATVPMEQVPQEIGEVQIYDLAKNDREGNNSDVTIIQTEPPWYYLQGKTQFGPVDFAELQYYAATGRLNPHDLVWTENMPDWIPAKDADGIFPHKLSGSLPDQYLSPLALASLIMGILGATIVFFVGSLIAIVLGHIALVQIRKSDGRTRGRPLALAGLILGYLIVIVSILVCFVILLVILLGSRPLPS
jgi:hypothetical protein